MKQGSKRLPEAKKSSDGTGQGPHSFQPIGATPYLCPTPTVLVGCAGLEGGGRPNLITVAWAGICCSHPPMVSIALRPERHSYGLIAETGEFTINLIGKPLLKAMDYCGVKSGRDLDKFEALDLHPIPAQGLRQAPALAESPAYLCCKVKQRLPLGSHELFVAEIVEVCVAEAFFTATGAIDEGPMELVSFVHGQYRAVEEVLGFFGYSIAKEEVLRRRMPPK